MLSEKIKLYEECLCKYDPDKLKLLQPGLTEEEINELLKSVDLILPDNLITLYSWRNGIENWDCLEEFFNGYSFAPLEQVVKDYAQFKEIGNEYSDQVELFWPPNSEKIKYGAFPVFQTDKYYLGISGLDIKDANSKIYSCSCWPNEESIVFSNLSKLFETLVSCYEQGIYPIPEDEYVYDYYEKIDKVRVQIDCNADTHAEY